MTDIETHIYKRVGDCELKANIYQRSETPSPSPILSHLHGGCLMYGSRGINEAQLEKFLANGYRVVSIDYRLAPETKLPEIIEDLQDAFSWVRNRGPDLFNADPDRLVPVGNSAGDISR